MTYKSRVSKARKFIGTLSIILAISGLGGCSSDKNLEKNKADKGIKYRHEFEMMDHGKANWKIKLPSSDDLNEDLKADESIINEDDINNGKDLVVIPGIKDYQGDSLVMALYAAGYPYDYQSRKELAEKLGIENYQGTATQNAEILRILKELDEKYNDGISNENMPGNGSSTNNSGSDNKVPASGADSENKTPSSGVENEGNGSSSIDDQDNNDEYNEHKHQFGAPRVKYQNRGGNHYKIIYKECIDGDYEEEISRSEEDHHFTSTYILKEKETDEGYDEVTYGYCEDCKEIIEISRRYIVKECDHTIIRKVNAIENENETSHDIVLYGICRCGKKVEIGRKTVLHDYEDKVVSNNDGTHSIVRTYTCSDGKKYSVIVGTNNCEYGDVLTRKEDVTKDGYYLVTYQTCSVGDCSYENVISKEYIDTKKCSHKKTHEVVEYENECAESHDEVTYDVCDKCGTKIFKSRVTKKHAYTDGNIKTNNDGTHSYTRTYICPNGKTYNVIMTSNCSYITQPAVIENESDKTHTYERVVYKICSCGHKEVVSRETINQTYTDSIVTSNNDGTHSYIRTYTRSNGSTYTEKVTNNCSYTKQQTVIENESDKTHTYERVVYKICSCGHKEVVARETINQTYTDGPKISNNDGTHSYTRTYTRSDGSSYSVTKGPESCKYGDILTRKENETETGYYLVTYKVCGDCGYESIISREYVYNHQHNYQHYVAIVDGVWKEYDQCINLDGHCPTPGRQNEVPHTNHNCTWDYDHCHINGDGHSPSGGKCSECDYVDSNAPVLPHNIQYGQYFGEIPGVGYEYEVYCLDCEYNSTVILDQELGTSLEVNSISSNDIEALSVSGSDGVVDEEKGKVLSLAPQQ